MQYLTFLLYGALGGLARGLIGTMKCFKNSNKSETLNWPKMIINIAGSTVIGAVVGLIVDVNPVTACSAGYAGVDIIEGLIKVSK